MVWVNPHQPSPEKETIGMVTSGAQVKKEKGRVSTVTRELHKQKEKKSNIRNPGGNNQV